jgi:alpha-tubulin suppressor-like RCC1 family protein
MMVDRNVPVRIGNDINWAVIDSVGYHTLAVKIDESIWTWGGNFYGQLGDETNNDRCLPALI